jgi:hypothetical protein
MAKIRGPAPGTKSYDWSPLNFSQGSHCSSCRPSQGQDFCHHRGCCSFCDRRLTTSHQPISLSHLTARWFSHAVRQDDSLRLAKAKLGSSCCITVSPRAPHSHLVLLCHFECHFVIHSLLVLDGLWCLKVVPLRSLRSPFLYRCTVYLPATTLSPDRTIFCLGRLRHNVTPIWIVIC